MNACDLVPGRQYHYREKVVTYASHHGRTWYFLWGRVVVCVWAKELEHITEIL